MASLVVAGLSALITALTFIYFLNRERIFEKRISRYLKEKEAVPRDAVEFVLRLAKDILDDMSLSGDNPQLLARRLRRSILSEEKEDESLVSSIQKLINYRYYGIADHLREICPELTEDDINMCSFICMSLPNHSLQFLFEYSNSASLYNHRSRIRRKLGITDSNVSLEEHLQGIVEKLRAQNSKREIFSLRKRKF